MDIPPKTRDLDTYFFRRIEDAAIAHATAEDGWNDYYAGLLAGMITAGLALGYGQGTLNQAVESGRYRCRNHVPHLPALALDAPSASVSSAKKA
jgi:hypothetical protein